LYGIDGNDVYVIEKHSNDIWLRIIGGPAKDSVVEINGNRTEIYDDNKNVFEVKNATLHLRNDSAVHVYDYASYNYNTHGLSPAFNYDYDDRLYVGLGYSFTNYAWRRTPFATKQKIEADYSFAQKTIRTSYAALFPDVFNKWNVTIDAYYDAIRWINFFGLGNESFLSTDDKYYFRMRTREWFGSFGVNKNFGKSNITISPFFRSVRILKDTQNYFAKEFLPFNTNARETNNYAGAQFTYTYLTLDDSIVPQRGITLSATANYSFNVSKGEFFQNYFGKAQAYIPLINKFSLAIKAGAATIAGNNILNSANFYEHAVIGGPENLRGFYRERFWGKTSFYNNNELRYITNVKTHLVNGKAGLLVFLDDGRVWMPGEGSDVMHVGYGAGIILAPFNKISAVVTYGISHESKLLQLSFNKLF
jgi:outer membrane protein assembly factor BamA